MKPLPREQSKPRPSFISTQVAEARRYYFDLDPKPGREAVIVCGGCERMRPDYVVARQGFLFPTIEFVAEGTGSLELAGVSYRLVSGMTFAYGPGVPHVIRNDPTRPMLKYYVSFSGAAAGRMLAKSALGAGRALQLSSTQEVTDIFELLQRDGAKENPYATRICAALLPVLILKIDEHAVPYGAGEPRAFETYQRAKRVIEQDFIGLRSAEEAARACHIDASYLCRLFQRFAHTTPYRFITKLRMNRAAELLLDERMLVKETADALEFADAFHFSRVFKRVYGISPERFVRQSHGGRAD